MLSPDIKRTNDQLNILTTANAAAMVWAKAIQETVLPVNAGEKTEWYAQLEQKLKLAREDAASWLDSGGPNLYADSLQSYISFNNLFSAASPKLRELISQAQAQHRPLSQAERELMGQLLNALLDEARSQHQTIRTHRDRLLGFRQLMSGHSAALDGILGAIDASAQADDAQIAKVQAKIARIREGFSALMTKEEQATDAGLKGLDSLVWMVTFGLVIADGVLSFSGVLTVATFSYAIFQIDKFSKKLNAAVHEINELLTSLAPATIRKLAFAEMAETLKTLNRQNEQAAIGIESADAIWAYLAEKLAIFTEIMQQPIENIGGYSDFISLELAEKHWSAIADHAAKLQVLQFDIQQERAA